MSGLSCAGVAIFSSGECSTMSGTVLFMNLSSISMRLFLNGFSNTSSTNVAFAWLPASSRATAALGGKAEVLDIADPDSRGDVGRRHLVDHELRAAVIEVVLGREDADPRRL